LTPLDTQHFDLDGALDALEAPHHPETTIKAHIDLDASFPP
jgi:L-iditol 2-dehydrogenase